MTTDTNTDAGSTTLGSFIRARRQRAQRSLRDVAEQVGITNTYLSQIERGVHQPATKVLRAIADALQLPDEQVLPLAGWVRGAPQVSVDLVDVVHADVRLSNTQRTALLNVYRSFVNE